MGRGPAGRKRRNLRRCPGAARRAAVRQPHLLVSVSGSNDALQQQTVLAELIGSVTDALLRLGEIRDDFAIAYDDMRCYTTTGDLFPSPERHLVVGEVAGDGSNAGALPPPTPLR